MSDLPFPDDPLACDALSPAEAEAHFGAPLRPGWEARRYKSGLVAVWDLGWVPARYVTEEEVRGDGG